MRPTARPLWTAEEGRRKDKGVRLSNEPRHLGERATCYFFLKNEVEKILEICEQQTVNTCFCLAC